jgi:hypothetical protein
MNSPPAIRKIRKAVGCDHFRVTSSITNPTIMSVPESGFGMLQMLRHAHPSRQQGEDEKGNKGQNLAAFGRRYGGTTYQYRHQHQADDKARGDLQR